MVLQAGGIADLVATTLNELGELKFTDLVSDLQKHIALKRLLKKNKVVFDSGKEIQWDVMTDHNASAAFVGLYASDNVNVPDVMTQGTVPFRHMTWNWAIERREVAMNRSPRKIVDLAKTRRIASFASAVEKLETRFWRYPASTDTTNPYGVPYWVVKTATAATYANANGFNGTAQSGYTSVGGINPTTYPRWCNYAAPYTAISKEDLVRAWRRACTMTDFEPVVDDVPVFNTGDDYGYYTNYSVLGPLEELLESQNDDLGTDLASMDGKVMFRRTAVTYVPALEDDTTGPIYGLNWGEFKTAGLRGEWLNETSIPIQPGQHTVSATHTDCSLNWFTRNRRRHFVLSTGTSMPA